MSFTFRPETRDLTRLILGLSGPTKSGKTMSAHRLAVGLAGDGQVVKINAEGPNGHLYADRFPCLTADITAPYRPSRFTEALKDALALKPAVVIIDSASHMHDGPGGLLQFHEEELDRIAGNDYKKRERSTWTAWIKPKAEENEFIYTMLGADCHIILCFRAKEKLKLVKGRDPIDLGWQPIAGDRITFETIFTLTLPPHSKGVPDLAASDMREPFDSMVAAGKQLDEDLGRALAAWAAGPSSAPTPKRRKVLTPPSVAGADEGQDAGAVVVAADDPPAPGPDVFEVTEEDVAAAQEAAGFVANLPNKDNWANGLTLAEINAHERGTFFFEWVLSDACPPGPLKDAATAYARVRLPFIYERLVFEQLGMIS